MPDLFLYLFFITLPWLLLKYSLILLFFFFTILFFRIIIVMLIFNLFYRLRNDAHSLQINLKANIRLSLRISAYWADIIDIPSSLMFGANASFFNLLIIVFMNIYPISNNRNILWIFWLSHKYPTTFTWTLLFFKLLLPRTFYMSRSQRFTILWS